MKIKLTIIAFVFNFFNLQAQTFKGVIINSTTKQAVSQITLVTEDNSFFTTTNDNGEVVLPNELLNKKLIIDDYEYVYSEKTFNTTENFTWELTPNSETLEEIVIYENASDFLLQIINNSIKSFSKNTKLESFYKENYIENNQVASFAEGIVDFYINDKIDMVAKQTRVKDIHPVEEFNRTVIGAPKELVENSMRFSILTELIKDKKNYDILVTAKKVGEQTIHTCYINPKEKSKKRFLRKVNFTYNEEKKLILALDYVLDPEKKQYNTTINFIIAKLKVEDILFKSKYIASNNLYYPSYVKATRKAMINSKLAKLKNVTINNESYFYALRADKTNELPKPERIYTRENLYGSGDIYNRDFWKDPEIINLSE